MHIVFVSFDFEHDKHYKYLLEAWHKNPRFKFVFEDGTPREINSLNVGRVKASLTCKIKEASHTLVIIGQHSNDPHSNQVLIGYKNWINFEIAQSKQLGKRIAAIKLNRIYESPTELLGANASWAYSFEEAAIVKALDEAPFPAIPRRYV